MNEIWGVVEEYLDTLRAAGRPNTTIALRRAQLRHMAAALGDCAVDDVTGDVLIGWFAGQVWRPETRRSYRAGVRGFFAWTQATGRTAGDPARWLPPVPQPVAVPHPAPDAIWTAAVGAADERTVLMLRLAAEAGLRRGEIAAIHSDDLVDGPTLVVHGKGGKDRVVPVSEALAAAIARRPAGWLFPNGQGGHLSAGWVGTVCSRVMDDVWTLHSLRHRFATRAYRGSRNLRAVQVLLGHASVVTTQRYTAVDDSELRAAMAAADFR